MEDNPTPKDERMDCAGDFILWIHVALTGGQWARETGEGNPMGHGLD